MADQFKESRGDILETLETMASGPTSTAKKKKKTMRERMLEWLMNSPASSVSAPGGPRHRNTYKKALEETE